MRIGIAQIDTVAGEFSQTVERMVAQSQRATERGVELLVFPLAALAGIELAPLADRPSFMRDVADALADLAERLACPTLVPVPVDLGSQDGFFDVMLLEGGSMRSLRLPSRMGGLFGAASNATDVTELTFAGVRFAFAFSYADLDALDKHDVDAVIFLSGYPFAVDDPSSSMGADLENARFAADALALKAWFVGVSSLGCYGTDVYPGSSFVLAPTGELATLAAGFEEALLVADLTLPAPDRLVEPAFPEVFDASFHLWQALVLGIHDFATKNGFTDVALCLDGSLSASVLAALASDAMGPLHVHALVGASAGAAAPTCRELARRLRIDAHDGTGQPQSFDAHDLDELELAALARECQGLVLSSADKTALALGACAGYTSVAALCPLGDVLRSDVIDMAHVRNTISPVFRRVAVGQADALRIVLPSGDVRTFASEQEITFVDEMLMGYVECDRSRGTLTAHNEQEAELIDAVLRTVRLSEIWRRRMPYVLSMSTQTLDDARFPLGVRWHDEHLDSMENVLRDFSEALRDLDIPSSEAKPAAKPEPMRPSRADIEQTLAMLRDLAEQGGFVPNELSTPADASELGPLGQALGWMTPFSEN